METPIATFLRLTLFITLPPLVALAAIQFIQTRLFSNAPSYAKSQEVFLKKFGWTAVT